MRIPVAMAGSVLASVLLAWSLPVGAHGGVQWSVTIGGGSTVYSGAYSGYRYPPSGVVIYPQGNFPYGPPPAAFAPPPAVIYTPPPQVVYPHNYHPRPGITIYPMPSYGYRTPTPNLPRDYRGHDQWRHDPYGHHGWNRGGGRPRHR